MLLLRCVTYSVNPLKEATGPEKPKACSAWGREANNAWEKLFLPKSRSPKLEKRSDWSTFSIAQQTSHGRRCLLGSHLLNMKRNKFTILVGKKTRFGLFTPSALSIFFLCGKLEKGALCVNNECVTDPVGQRYVFMSEKFNTHTRVVADHCRGVAGVRTSGILVVNCTSVKLICLTARPGLQRGCRNWPCIFPRVASALPEMRWTQQKHEKSCQMSECFPAFSKASGSGSDSRLSTTGNGSRLKVVGICKFEHWVYFVLDRMRTNFWEIFQLPSRQLSLEQILHVNGNFSPEKRWVKFWMPIKVKRFNSFCPCLAEAVILHCGQQALGWRVISIFMGFIKPHIQVTRNRVIPQNCVMVPHSSWWSRHDWTQTGANTKFRGTDLKSARHFWSKFDHYFLSMLSPRESSFSFSFSFTLFFVLVVALVTASIFLQIRIYLWVYFIFYSLVDFKSRLSVFLTKYLGTGKYRQQWNWVQKQVKSAVLNKILHFAGMRADDVLVPTLFSQFLCFLEGWLNLDQVFTQFI